MTDIDTILGEIGAVLKAKQHDYATSESPLINFERSASILKCRPEEVIVANLAQKVSRIHNLISEERTPNFEPLNDSINDLIGYAILLRQWSDSKR